jgi:hypothetical protein
VALWASLRAICARPHFAPATNYVNSIVFLVILTLPLDTQKNWYVNGGTGVPDKPDFRVLNPHTTYCVGVFVL